MCGILAAIHSTIDPSDLDAIRHRGPDDTALVRIGPHALGFHRLAINDLTAAGNQPLRHPEDASLVLVCNGEIYNHREIAERYGFRTESRSDCEIILHLYRRFGIERTLAELDGYFAFVLLDGEKAFAARDEIGVRPLFVGTNEVSANSPVFFGSEVKALGHCSVVQPFPPGTWWCSTDRTYVPFSDLWSTPVRFDPYVTARTTVRASLEEAVRKRVDASERPIGCLLSGGLDSSIICALVQRRLTESGQRLRTFSIGLEGSTDLHFARIVAEHLGTDHHELVVTEKDMIDAIPEVVRTIESYDTTTVRASTPMYLLCRYVATTPVRVLFSGEGSDELSGSYLYFHQAPSAEAFYEETVRLMRELHYFDVLRADRSVAAHGLELRVPFLDRHFMRYYLHLDPCLKQPASFGIEKYLLRDAFVDLLPKCISERSKAAFSDAVSSPERSWFEIIQEHVGKLKRDGKLEEREYAHCPPALDETRWYRQLFEASYPGRADLIPHLWLPLWSGEATDPSARTLSIYRTVGSAQ
jgi:asparagine synthase (glutamine-hydrolysing)